MRCTLALARLAGIAVATTLLVGAPAHADGRWGRDGHGGPDGRWGRSAWGPHVVFDGRYHHDRFYPSVGYAVGGLPGGSLSVSFNGGHYFFRSGVWFRPVGPRYVVVSPPLGVLVPVLPPLYSTVWVAGTPYYYANGVYYRAVPNEGYEVTRLPPPEVATPVPQPSPPVLPEPVVYPREQQSPLQTQADRQACNQWASQQPGASEPSVFQRAQAACLDGRGYTVR